jgi:uncharacterized protein (DUF2147 family)
MKFLAFTTVILLLAYNSFAQSNNIEGLWYSGDSTRVYTIQKNSNNYTATLYTSKKINEKPGIAVLSNIEQSRDSNEFHGYIHALDDGTTTALKITTHADGNELHLKLRRMFIFPLKLTWYRVAK